jgi:carbamoyl-phosphate synthase large subunit
LRIKGLFNIQFVLDRKGHLFVLEVNPRASRTVPILSKVTRTPMVALATRVILGETLAGMGYTTGLIPESPFTTVKGPVFSFSKMTTVDIFLGPEMKSTGEVMGTAPAYEIALRKAMLAAGLDIPASGSVLFSVAQRDYEEASVLAGELSKIGFTLYATPGTGRAFQEKGLAVTIVEKDAALHMLKEDGIDLVINTPTRGKIPSRWGFSLRRTAMEFNIPCITSLDTARAALIVLQCADQPLKAIPLAQYHQTA